MSQIDPKTSLCAEGRQEITGQNFALLAEQAMKSLMEEQANAGRRAPKLTTTKLRSIYGMIMNTNTAINSESDFAQRQPELQYLKVRMAYEAGREAAVKAFLNKTGLMDVIASVQSYDQFLLYCRYAESLVAYFKFYGGRDR